MKITFHNSFMRYEEHIAGNCDEIVREIFDKVIMNLITQYPKLNIITVYKIPSFDEARSRDSLFDSSVAPRLWVDVCVDWTPGINDIELLEILLKSDFNIDNEYCTALFEIANSYQHQIELALLAANISAPGSVSYTGGFLQFEDGTTYFTLPDRGNYISEHRDEIVALGWPKTFSVNFEDAWSWVNGVVECSPDVTNSKTSRALAAFSMIACGAEEWRSQLLLFWAMMGLEALYCDGSEGLKHQLFEKSQVILGPILENKKLIKKMYDTRSEFVHGSMNIPYVYAHDYDSDEIDQFRDEISRTSTLAIQMLVATLQFMVLNNIKDLNFKYGLS